jgi:hypothetical protein
MSTHETIHSMVWLGSADAELGLDLALAETVQDVCRAPSVLDWKNHPAGIPLASIPRFRE